MIGTQVASTTSASLLSTVVAATRRIVEVRAARRPRARLEADARARVPRCALFVEALTRSNRVNVVAECKRRSPARGVLRDAYDVAVIAREYEAAGAAAISVLTEPTFFDGDPDHLAAVRDVASIPVLRKDFIVDPYQLYEARAIGADAVLLIVAALGEPALRTLLEEARALGLAVLVEVHDEAELDLAVSAGASIVGVNNRNLRTLDVSLDVAVRLIDAIPDACVAVAESGLQTGADLVRLRELGYDAFLMGERFMTAPRPGRALRDVLEAAAVAAGRESSG
ncbi:MAG: indole-3-glycerol phosphate synthase TrpC [Luteitalea sp.]|nr:indole-3-glycerol phosphate synthase TrpC [Luteitalea sp.]